MGNFLVSATKHSWVPAGILFIAVCFIVGGSQLRGDAGLYPVAVGIITAVLAAFELVQRLLHRSDSLDAADTARRLHILLILAWFLGTILALYVLGVLLGIAISATLYFRIFAGFGFGASAGIGLSHTAFFWIVFEILAGFRLYQGLFFG